MPLRLQMSRAADESACASTVRPRPKSSANICNPRPSLAPFTTPASPASPELSVTAFWVLAQCLMRWLPRRAQPPEVLLRVAAQPAQSVSANTARPARPCIAHK